MNLETLNSSLFNSQLKKATKDLKTIDMPTSNNAKNIAMPHLFKLVVNDTLRMYKNDDIRMYNFNCITDTIVEVITTCNTYTLLTVHLL